MPWHRRLALVASLALAAAVPAAEGGDYEATVTNPAGPPMLGIEMSPVPTHVQERENLTPNQGVYVQNTFSNTAAQTMGIKAGDVVLSVNGAPIGSMTDLRNEVGLNTVGDPVDVVVVRNGQHVSLNAPLQEWPKEIARERIDPESERRFREWQQQRQAQQRQQVDEMKQKLAALDAELPPALDAEQQAAADALDRRISSGARPWSVDYRIVTPRVEAPAADATAIVADAGTDSQAWRMSWRSRGDAQ